MMMMMMMMMMMWACPQHAIVTRNVDKDFEATTKIWFNIFLRVGSYGH
jgi:hypothetical protein